MGRGERTSRHLGCAVVVVGTAFLGIGQALGDSRPASPPTPPGQTNGPLAYQDQKGTRLVQATAVRSAEDRAAQDTGTVEFPIQPATNPVWSPSGARLAFNRRVNGRRQIFVTEEGKRGARQLTNDPIQATDPTWSRTGRQIAFTSYRDGRAEIYTIDIDRKNERRLTFDGGRSPDWSPAGDRIAYMSGRAGTLDIWVMNVDGSNQQPVTSLPGVEADPEWRPDKAALAFAGVTSGQSHIFVIRPDGTGMRRLTGGDVVDRFPAWAPTGGAIAFSRIAGKNGSTWVVNTTDPTNPEARLEIRGGVRADWGALPVPPANAELLNGATTVQPLTGSDDVSVALPNSKQAAELGDAGARVPDGTIVRAPAGEPVKLVAATPDSATTPGAGDPVTVQAEGTFEILPPDETGEVALTLRLRGDGPACGGGDKGVVAAKKSSKKKVGVKKKGGGGAKTVGKHGSGTDKGTEWTMEETCEGTLTRVREGTVEVFDRGLGRTVLVKAGETYLAQAR